MIFPTASEVFEVSPENDRFVVYNSAEGAEDGGCIDIYSLSSGSLVDTVPLAPPQRVLAFTPDSIFAWIADDLEQGRLARMNLWTREIDRTIQVTLPSPPLESLQVQVDRENSELLVVRAASSGVDATVTAYLGSKLLPAAAPLPSPLPITTDDRGRYLFRRQACNLDPSAGFTQCSTIANSDITLLWKDKYLSGGDVYSLSSGEFLGDISTQKFIYHKWSNRLIGGGTLVDGDTLETWTPSEVANSIVRTAAPDWVISTEFFIKEQSPSVPGVLATRLPELAAVPKFTASAVVHGAAFSPGGIAPGQIVSIFGENLGSEGGSLLTWEGPLELTTELDGVRVLFGGYAEPCSTPDPRKSTSSLPKEFRVCKTLRSR